LIHPIDRAASIALARAPARLHFFSDGWGDNDLLTSAPIVDTSPPTLPINWLSRSVEKYNLTIDHGTFTSPSRLLPHRSKQGSVISISPPAETHRVVVLMPAWNEHDPRVRVAMAGHLARKGIRSIILENPYYGSRNPHPGRGQPIRTVADFMVMGAAAVNEARGILMWLSSEGWDIGVAGYSMGGNTTAIAGATMPVPLAIAPLAASHSPGPVFLDGVLRKGIAWDALGGRSQEKRLRSTLGAISVLNVEPLPHTAHAVVVRASRDGYVPASAVEALSDHWPGSELRVVRGGHATAIWYRKDQLTDAIVESFDRLAGL
jgi:hypothetical protein